MSESQEAKAHESNVATIGKPTFTNPVLQFLQHLKLKNIVATREYTKHPSTQQYVASDLITVCTSDTVQETVNKLSEFNISSLPVIMPGEELRGVCVGFIDMLDIASFAVTCFPDITRINPTEQVELFRKVCSDVANTKVQSMFNKHWKDLHPTYEESACTKALALFAQGTPRLPLFDQFHGLSGICSQMDIVRAICQHFDLGTDEEYNKMLKRPLRDFGYSTPAPASHLRAISLLPTSTMLQAMLKFGLTGSRSLAIVNPDTGDLLGNLSVTDIRASFLASSKAEGYEDEIDILTTVTHSFLGMLGTTTVETYLQKYHPSSLDPLCVYSDCMLINACKEMVRTKKHQVWVVNPDRPKFPVRLLTLTDICYICEKFVPGAQQWLSPQPVSGLATGVFTQERLKAPLRHAFEPSLVEPKAEAAMLEKESMHLQSGVQVNNPSWQHSNPGQYTQQQEQQQQAQQQQQQEQQYQKYKPEEKVESSESWTTTNRDERVR